MSIGKVTFDDKIDLKIWEEIDEIHKITSDNINEIKNTVNENADELEKTEKDVSTLKTNVNSIEEKVNNVETKISHIYGIKRLITDNTLSSWTRIADAEGLTANATKDGTIVSNDFDKLYPWSHIRRCNVDVSTGEVLAYYGETGYKADGSNGEVMVRIPEFWWKRERLSDESGNVYEYIYIVDYARAGYIKSEEFFVGAYLLSTEETETGTTVAHSRSGVVPKYNTNRANFRTYARALGTGWQLMDYHYFLLQMLYLVEYAHFNSQSMLGNGLVGFSTAKALLAENNTNRIIVASADTGFWIGKTICIGATSAWNGSVAVDREITSIEDYNDGTITGKAIYFSGDPVNIIVDNVIWGSAQKTGGNDELGNASGSLNNDNYHSVNYRGIEDVFGHLWQHIDGINIKNYEAYICKEPNSYTDDKFDSPYEKIGYVNANITDSYIKKLGLDEKYPEVAFPIEVEGSSSTGVCDNYWFSEGDRIAFAGGLLRNSLSKAGFFAWACEYSSSHSYWDLRC